MTTHRVFRGPLRLGAFLAVAALALGTAARAAELPRAPADWTRIVDRPRAVSFTVERPAGDGGRGWIRLAGSFEAVYRVPFDVALETCWLGMDEAARIYGRVDSARILFRGPTRVVAEQVTGVRILGLDFLSTVTFDNELERVSERAARVVWRVGKSDGSMRRGEGWWYFEELRGGDDPMTYVAYLVDSEVVQRFPGQLGIMKSFGAGDLERMLDEYAREAYRRADRR